MLRRVTRFAGHNVVKRTFLTEALFVSSAAGAVAMGAYVAAFYKVAKPHEKIVVTGPFIDGKEMKICKTALILPFQKHRFISNMAHSINTNLSAMTIEKIPFSMPMYFTVCPNDSTEQTLSIYAKKFGDMTLEQIDDTIESVVHGEARLLTGGMEVETIFNNRSQFKVKMTEKIQECLDPFGVLVVNVNIGELKDSQQSEYFKNLSERALQQAQREANVATAEHAFNTESEKKGFEGESRKRIAATESDAVTTENFLQQTIVKSKTELKVFEANQHREAELARLEAEASAKKRAVDLQREVEEKRRELMIEQQKANELSKALVDKDKLIVDTEARAEQMRRMADADRDKLLIETEARAEQLRRMADAEAYQVRQNAEARLYASTKEAEGILAVQSARAEGLKRNVEASGGNIKFLESYKMVDEGRHENIAEKYADAVRGMNPTIFTNGSEGGVSRVLTDIGGSASALATAYKKQTGIDVVESFLPLLLKEANRNKESASTSQE